MGCLRLVDRWRYRLRLVHAKKAVTSKSTHKSVRSDSPYHLAFSKLDAETGLHHFSARYYIANLSIWTTVDMMSAYRPSLTPYNFVQNNPIGRIDPTGALDEDIIEIVGEDGSTTTVYTPGMEYKGEESVHSECG